MAHYSIINYNIILFFFNYRPDSCFNKYLKTPFHSNYFFINIFFFFFAILIYHHYKVQIYNHHIKKKCIINKILYFNFQPNILYNKYLLHNTLYFIIPFFIPNPATPKYSKYIYLDYFYIFHF